MSELLCIVRAMHNLDLLSLFAFGVRVWHICSELSVILYFMGNGVIFSVVDDADDDADDNDLQCIYYLRTNDEITMVFLIILTLLIIPTASLFLFSDISL